MPNAQCPMPNAQCQCSMQHARASRASRHRCVRHGHWALSIEHRASTFNGSVFASPSLSSIDVPHGSVMNAIHISVFGTCRYDVVHLDPRGLQLLGEGFEVLHFEADVIDGSTGRADDGFGRCREVQRHARQRGRDELAAAGAERWRRIPSHTSACISAGCVPKKCTWCSAIGVVCALFSTSSTFTSSGAITKAIDGAAGGGGDVVRDFAWRHRFFARHDPVAAAADPLERFGKVRHREPKVIDGAAFRAALRRLRPHQDEDAREPDRLRAAS